jgi:hypothetical protein
LYIQTFQSEYITEPISPEFAKEARQQAESIKLRNKIIRGDPEVFRDLEPSDDYYKAGS